MRLQQHEFILCFSISRGSGKQQIGHSPILLSSGCLNNLSSRNSANRFLHAFLCCGRWFFWHSTLQYFTSLQAVHILSVMSSTAALPQLAHTSSASSELLICYYYCFTGDGPPLIDSLNPPIQQAITPTTSTSTRATSAQKLEFFVFPHAALNRQLRHKYVLQHQK